MRIQKWLEYKGGIFSFLDRLEKIRTFCRCSGVVEGRDRWQRLGVL